MKSQNESLTLVVWSGNDNSVRSFSDRILPWTSARDVRATIFVCLVQGLGGLGWSFWLHVRRGFLAPNWGRVNREVQTVNSAGGQKVHTEEHTHTHTQERTCECCTYPLAAYPLKSALAYHSKPLRNNKFSACSKFPTCSLSVWQGPFVSCAAYIVPDSHLWWEGAPASHTPPASWANATSQSTATTPRRSVPVEVECLSGPTATGARAALCSQ